jgi:hypothetical protein
MSSNYNLVVSLSGMYRPYHLLRINRIRIKLIQKSVIITKKSMDVVLKISKEL